MKIKNAMAKITKPNTALFLSQQTVDSLGNMPNLNKFAAPQPLAEYHCLLASKQGRICSFTPCSQCNIGANWKFLKNIATSLDASGQREKRKSVIFTNQHAGLFTQRVWNDTLKTSNSIVRQCSTRDAMPQPMVKQSPMEAPPPIGCDIQAHTATLYHSVFHLKGHRTTMVVIVHKECKNTPCCVFVRQQNNTQSTLTLWDCSSAEAGGSHGDLTSLLET